MAEGFDFGAVAARLNGCGDECGDALCRDARTRIEIALRAAYVDALEHAISYCPDDFCAGNEECCKHCGRIHALADQVRRG